MTEQKSSSKIARAALAIKAIKLSINLAVINLFTWAKGWKTPIYNDNRLHLSYPENRNLIVKAMEEKVGEEKLAFDGILLTKSAGIAWGVLLGDILGKPVFMISDEGEVYTFPYNKELVVNENPSEYDLVASDSPFGIPLGVRIAHHFNKGFIYVRPETKTHGLKNKVEGAYQQGQKIYYVDSGMYGVNKTVENMEFLSELSEDSIGRGMNDVPMKEVSIAGLRLVGIEDLISTGGSSLDEAVQARALGATITDIITIFSYKFPVAAEKAEKAGVTVHSLLDYNELLEEAVAAEYIQPDMLEILKTWREDPITWSDEHGETTFTKKQGASDEVK